MINQANGIADVELDQLLRKLRVDPIGIKDTDYDYSDLSSRMVAQVADTTDTSVTSITDSTGHSHH